VGPPAGLVPAPTSASVYGSLQELHQRWFDHYVGKKDAWLLKDIKPTPTTSRAAAVGPLHGVRLEESTAADIFRSPVPRRRRQPGLVCSRARRRASRRSRRSRSPASHSFLQPVDGRHPRRDLPQYHPPGQRRPTTKPVVFQTGAAHRPRIQGPINSHLYAPARVGDGISRCRPEDVRPGRHREAAHRRMAGCSRCAPGLGAGLAIPERKLIRRPPVHAGLESRCRDGCGGAGGLRLPAGARESARHRLRLAIRPSRVAPAAAGRRCRCRSSRRTRNPTPR